MSNMEDALEKGGLNPGPGGRQDVCPKCGRRKKPEFSLCPECARKKNEGPVFRFPEGYPDYFDASGIPKTEYITTLADDIAEAFKNAVPRLTMHQLRGFYRYVRRREAALKTGGDLRRVIFGIARLKPVATERANKNKIPAEFRDFIEKNVDKVMSAGDDRTFIDGFVEHFQAVVAYCAGRLEREG